MSQSNFTTFIGFDRYRNSGDSNELAILC